MSDLAKFGEVVLEVVATPKGRAFTALDVGRALGYTHPTKKISGLHRSHLDEFVIGKHWDWWAEETGEIQIPQNGDSRKGIHPTSTRIYYQSGINLLAMFATTANAKTFRRWAADILTDVQQGQLSYEPQAAPINLRDRILGELAQRDLSSIPTSKLLQLLESTGN